MTPSTASILEITQGAKREPTELGDNDNKSMKYFRIGPLMFVKISPIEKKLFIDIDGLIYILHNTLFAWNVDLKRAEHGVLDVNIRHIDWSHANRDQW